MKILCINGQGGVGKDSFVNFCGSEDEGIYNISMIDGVKKIAETIGWTGGKTPKDRKFLSDLKDLMSKYNDYPFQYTLKEAKDAIKDYRFYHDLSNEFICFIHAREPNDIDRWVNDYGARALMIRRPEVEGEYGNHADDGVFEVEYYDYKIWNTGDLYQLKDTAKRFIAQIREEEWESNIWKK